MAEETDPKTRLEEAFIGLHCTSVKRFAAESWKFEFEGRTTLDVRCPWRIVAEGRIALGNGDACRGGRPLDSQQEAELLVAAPVANVALRQPTGDLTLELEQGTSLEIFNSSSGLEGWQCATTGGLLAIAHGGGEIGVWIIDPSLASGKP